MNDIWNVQEHEFNAMALEIFQFQAKNNMVYAEFLDLIDKSADKISKREDIPFLPISLFKSRKVITGAYEAEKVFESSSTTGIGISKQHVKNIQAYLDNTVKIFEQHYGSLKDYTVLGLLPNYLERNNSSLIAMVDHFIAVSETVKPQYFLYEHKDLMDRLQNSGKTLLFGVSFALLDFIETYEVAKDDLLIIETGGMKGRKKEITKEEVYNLLQNGFPNARIRSEYGMTELMSQAYSDSTGLYHCPAWMKVSTRLDNDPLSSASELSRGGLNIIDLANINTCSFIATDDLGRVHPNGQFEVLGRLDISDLRGCSLMVS